MSAFKNTLTDKFRGIYTEIFTGSNDPNAMIQSQQRYANDLPLYEKVLRVFLADPKNPDSKPGGAPQPRIRNND